MVNAQKVVEAVQLAVPQAMALPEGVEQPLAVRPRVVVFSVLQKNVAQKSKLSARVSETLHYGAAVVPFKENVIVFNEDANA